MSATSDYIRQDFGDGDTLRDKGLSTPPDVERFDNIKLCRSSSVFTAAVGSTAIRTGISSIAWSLAGGDLPS